MVRVGIGDDLHRFASRGYGCCKLLARFGGGPVVGLANEHQQRGVRVKAVSGDLDARTASRVKGDCSTEPVGVVRFVGNRLQGHAGAVRPSEQRHALAIDVGALSQIREGGVRRHAPCDRTPSAYGPANSSGTYFADTARLEAVQHQHYIAVRRQIFAPHAMALAQLAVVCISAAAAVHHDHGGMPPGTGRAENKAVERHLGRRRMCGGDRHPIPARCPPRRCTVASSPLNRINGTRRNCNIADCCTISQNLRLRTNHSGSRLRPA